MGGGGEEICFEGMRGDWPRSKTAGNGGFKIDFKTYYKDGKVSDIDKEHESFIGGGGLDGEG